MLKQAIAEHGSQTILLSLWKSMPYRDNWSDIVSSRFWLEGSVSTYQAAVERTDVGIYSFGGWYDDFRREGRDEYTVNYDVDCPKAVGLGQTCVLDDKGITYTSEVLQNSMELTGHPILHLWVASSTAENNFFAYLEDVAPDGSVFIVTDGRLKGSLRALSTPPYHYKGIPYHRSFQEDAIPFSPGKPEEVVFDCLPLSHVFKPGHRIRLTITGADPREKDRVNLSPPPVITIFTGSTHSSYVKLPVIPDNTAAGAPELISSIKNGRSYK
jgi:predicted acyl esterase